MKERMRHVAAMAGILWWLAFPFVFSAGDSARWEYRCGGQTPTTAFDDCFNDSIPMAEMLAFPMTLVLAYPFIRFAFSIFAPRMDDRVLRWRFAASGGGVEYFPAFQLTSAVGVIWACLHLFSMPFATRYWSLLLYWIIWIFWFLLGALASSRYAEPKPTIEP